MKKRISMLIVVCMILALTACGTKKENQSDQSPAAGKPQAEEAEKSREAEKPQAEEAEQSPEAETPQAAEAVTDVTSGEESASSEEETAASAQQAGDWTRQGYYEDENNYMLSVAWMDDIDVHGWYAGLMIGEDISEDTYSGTLQPGEGALHGTLRANGKKPDLTVTISEDEGEGLQVAVEGGETYHFTPIEMEEASIIVRINTEGAGDINYAEGRETPEIDEDYPYQSAQINLAEPTVYTFAAAPQTGYLFVKWTKDGKDCSTVPIITVNLDESADYVAVFEENPDWQNPVVKLSGEYQCDRAHATVQDFDLDSAWITIEWAGSAWETARWIISGPLDIGTMTITYEGCQKDHLVYDETGEITSQEKIYEDGTGTIVFNGDGTFTWHEDQSETGEDMTFELLPAEQE